jgi:fucokinase
MLKAMRPHAYGQSMAGAGGGGFMYVLTKQPNAAAEMEALVRAEVPGVEEVRFHQCEVDSIGLHIHEMPAGRASADF